MLRKIARVVGWVLGSFVVLAVALYLIILAINWRDAAPSQAATHFMTLYQDRPRVADADNAYIDVMGFGVAPGEDSRAMGRRRIEWLANADRTGLLDHRNDPLVEPVVYVMNRKFVVKQLAESCSWDALKCATALERGDAAAAEWLNAEDWLLDRYEALIARPGWLESVPSNLAAPFPAYSSVMDGQKLLLIKVYALIRAHDLAAARQLLASDIRFWRHVLASSDTLITKMIATSAIKRHFELGNIVLKHVPPDSILQVVPDEWRIAVSDTERSMQRSIVGEWVFSANAMAQIAAQNQQLTATSGGDVDDSWVSRLASRLVAPMFKRQDTNNKSADHYARIIDALTAPLDGYETAMRKASTIRAQTDPAFSLSSPYNIIGNWLLSVGASDFGNYGGRVADIEGVRRAAVAAVTLRSEGVKPEDAAAALAQSPLRNPYNGEPFTWDAEKQAIVFKGLEASERGLHMLLL